MISQPQSGPAVEEANGNAADDRPSAGRLHRLILALVLIIHAGLLAYQSYFNAPNLDESAHLTAGYSHWEFGNFTLYRVNPPLIRMWAAVPLLVTPPETDWSGFSDTPFSRSEFSVGTAFHSANGLEAFWYCTLARWVLIPVSLMAAWVCWRWATELFGPDAGLLAATLWCFCPNALAWGASITPDTGSAAFGILAAWRFRQWLRDPSWKNAGIAGAVLGLVQLTKTTWVILFGMWPLLWAVWFFFGKKDEAKRPSVLQLGLILAMALYLLNLGYGFEESGLALKEFTFISQTLGGELAHDDGGNRFRDTWLGELPVPVPANYVRGVDVQKYDFERGKWSYLRGEQKEGGWWYYYLYALLVKTPIGFLVLIAVSVAMWVCCRSCRADWRDEMLLIVPAAAILVLVSSQTGFNRYLRYVLPAMPFVYVFAARVAASLRGMRRAPIAVVVLLCGAGIVSSLSVFPYSMAYFNYAVGGPSGGRDHLLDGNLDWGQDLLRFRDWVDEHPDARPLMTSLTTFVPLDSIGIESQAMGGGVHGDDEQLPQPEPGWYAIGVNHLMGYRLFGSQQKECMRFMNREPVEVIGHTIYIFHVENESGDRKQAADEL